MSNTVSPMPEAYAIPVGEHFGCSNTAVYLAYAPLYGAYGLMNAAEAQQLQAILHDAAPTTQHEFLTALKDCPKLARLPAPETPDDIWEVDLLLNNICNFHCSYCYSAAGRSNKRMPEPAWRKTIDFIFAEERKNKLPVRIHFSGGGEPLISFPEIQKVVAYIEEKHAESGRRYSMGIVSNGSLLTDEIIEYIRDKKIDLVISFEVLPELQNRERGAYDKVKANLARLHELNCPFGIRSPLTEDALPLLPTMLDTLKSEYPYITSLTVEPVHSPEWYGTPEKLKSYFDLFYEVYTKAHEQAEKLGIFLGSNTFALLKYRRKAKCMCKMVVTAEGTISYCARVAASTEPLYDRFIYGTCNTDTNAPVFDAEKFAAINRHNIEEQPQCRQCFARWNCGGDCSLFHQTYPAECYEVSCEFTRKCLIWEILCCIRKAFEKQYPGKDFEQHVRDSI